MIGDPAEDDSLPTLVDGVRAGRRGALERLVVQIERRIRRWAVGITADQDEAEDVTQDVLVTLERRVKLFAGTSEFSTWLFQVTRNAALQRMRRDTRRARLLLVHSDSAERSVEHRDELDDHTMAGLVAKYVADLPQRQREIFELADMRGHSPTEIAGMLGIEAVTVRTNLFKARKAIRSRILEQHPKLLEEYLS